MVGSGLVLLLSEDRAHSTLLRKVCYALVRMEEEPIVGAVLVIINKRHLALSVERFGALCQLVEYKSGTDGEVDNALKELATQYQANVNSHGIFSLLTNDASGGRREKYVRILVEQLKIMSSKAR